MADAEGAMAGTGTAAGPILVVDDDRPLREALVYALERNGRATAEAADSGEAIAWLAAQRPALLLLDLSLPTAGGEAVGAALRARYGHRVPVVAMSAGRDAAVIAARLGARELLRKPFDLAELLDVVRHTLGDPGADGERPA